VQVSTVISTVNGVHGAVKIQSKRSGAAQTYPYASVQANDPLNHRYGAVQCRSDWAGISESRVQGYMGFRPVGYVQFCADPK
jgi:hypothetical protein